MSRCKAAKFHRWVAIWGPVFLRGWFYGTTVYECAECGEREARTVARDGRVLEPVPREGNV